MTEFERCLRAGRKEKRLTQGDLAEMAGVKRTDIINLESGIFAPLDHASLCRIASVTGMEESMFRNMYLATFRQELKELRPKRSPAPDGSSAAEAGSAETETPGLAGLEKDIMSIPPETRAGLVSTIRMLVRAASLTAV